MEEKFKITDHSDWGFIKDRGLYNFPSMAPSL